ncbi:N-acetylmuramic acid 6-phosphate etherase [Weissella diestrammenae]|uniref:N-acetylmuramic acid 6-phosphate etherase n=1 Tax=Weissella diestrammenae TaxID=1162633 RepID=A0A7G9T3K7_9LACO|nr:N-acetylmuramic acid 6-phosphate etherase [Weissella diestrammenae]MCM0582656.1 N-acetylmuramic acid 6-phosphate etherase [Weissella diestrammenae]QNN74682.1 N-acetylmuramic acid 6-phosphate etherase [Weissella diestrammenae]
MNEIDLAGLTTEQRNVKTMNLDELSVHDAAVIMNQEDQGVAVAVARALPEIEIAITKTIAAFQAGGRLIYMGAGTSGRLGVLDAAECVPTFGVDASMVIGLIAGGPSAMTVAVEGAEDDAQLGAQNLKDLQLQAQDIVVGIAASGRTPYVIGGLDYAQSVGAQTVSLALNRPSVIGTHAQTAIEIEVGPEFLTGSTRLKSGTAQKLVLNMISTLSMIGIGKVYKNLMVDVRPTNEKLVERAKQIIISATGVDYHEASVKLELAGGEVKTAIVMILTNSNRQEAEQKLVEAKGFVKRTL